MEPGGTATVPLKATTAQRSHIQDKHTESRSIYDIHHNMDAALNTMVIEEINNTCVFTLHNVLKGYMGSSTKDIINHLMDRCGRITEADIKINKNPLNNPSNCRN